MTLKIPFEPPPRNLELADDEVHLFCASLDQPLAQMEQLTGLLSEDEHVRASRFIFERDRNRFVAGRGMLREILGWLLHAEPTQLAFAYGDHGKPRLAAPVSGRFLHFNLAHSDSLIVFAVSPAQEVGVDVERIRPVGEAEKIAAQFFSERECARWHSLPTGQQTEAFFNCWTRKEALLKAIGEGIGRALNQTEVFFGDDSPKGRQCMLRSLPTALDYSAAVAIKSRIARVNCWNWNKQRDSIPASGFVHITKSWWVLTKTQSATSGIAGGFPVD